MQNYMVQRRAEGWNLHYPDEDTEQDDPSGGVSITYTNTSEIQKRHFYFLYWNPTSTGSLWDLANVYNQVIEHGKDLIIMNPEFLIKRIQETCGF